MELVIYEHCLNCSFRNFEEVQVRYVDKDCFGECRPSHKTVEQCVHQPVCSFILDEERITKAVS